jgi:hypothetical protein
LSVFLISLAYFFNSVVHSAAAPASNERWVCLNAKRCGDCDDTNGDGLPDAGSCYLYPTEDPLYAAT